MDASVRNIIMLIIAVMQYCSISTAVAGGGDKGLSISFDAARASKYIWRGQDVYDDHAAFGPNINFDLYGTGLSANVWITFADSSCFRNAEEYDYSFT